jgi:APA family basic amino acid/polyamine antiporter
MPANLTKGIFSAAPIMELLQGHAHVDASKALIDVPAVFIVLLVTGLLVIGTRESATVNIVLVLIKLAALVMFVIIAAPHFHPEYLKPIAPQGWGATPHADGRNYGILGAAGLVFFAFYGFDAVSTAAEETKEPSRDLTIGIIGSMVLCTAIYMAVAASALGASYFGDFSKSAAPLVYILSSLRHGFAAQVVASAAIIALPTVILVLMYGQSRIFFVMARDGLLPQSLSTVHKTRGTPVLMTALTGIVVAVLAATLKLDQIALLANAGTLCAFVAVALSMLVLRLRDPGRVRPFRTPLPWVVGPVCIVGCLYLFFNGLPAFTQWWFLFWNGTGLIVYFAYGAWRSRLGRAAA